MENQLPFTSTAKDFLTGQEKKLGAAASTGILIVLALAGIYFSVPILTLINSFLSLAIGAVGKLIALGALAFVTVIAVMFLLDERTWTLLWHVQHAFTRWLSIKWMKKNPIGRLRAFADEYLVPQYNRFINLKGVVETQLERLNGDIDVQEKSTKIGEEGREAAEKKAKYLRDHYFNATRKVWDTDDHAAQFQLLSQRVAMLEDNLKALGKNKTLLEYAVKVLDKFATTFRFKIQSTQQSAKLLEMRYESAKAVHGALEAIKSAFGFGDMAQFDQMTRDYIESEIAGYLGQSEAILKAIPELTSGEALSGEMAVEDMMKRLEKWDALADQASLEAKQDHDLLASSPEQVLEVVKPRVLEPVGRYRGLLGSDRDRR